MLKNMTVRSRLIWAFGVLVALVLLVCAVALHTLGEVNESLNRFHNVDVQQYRLTVAVRDAVNRRAIAARNLVLAQNKSILLILGLLGATAALVAWGLRLMNGF